MAFIVALRLGLACALALVATAGAQASVIYVYEGNLFDTFTDQTPPAGTTYGPGDRITAVFELPEPLAPSTSGSDVTLDLLSASVSDGVFTLDASNATLQLGVTTDAIGNISEWFFEAETPSTFMVGDQRILVTSYFAPTSPFVPVPAHDGAGFAVAIECNLAGPCDVESFDGGFVQNDPGTWTVIVPEPGTLTLVGLGLTALAQRQRRPERRGPLTRARTSPSSTSTPVAQRATR